MTGEYIVSDRAEYLFYLSSMKSSHSDESSFGGSSFGKKKIEERQETFNKNLNAKSACLRSQHTVSQKTIDTVLRAIR